MVLPLQSCAPYARRRFPLHGFTQELVDPRLVTTPLALKPRQHIGIHANRHRPLDGTVKLPPTAPRHSRTSGASVKSVLSSGMRQRREFLCYSPRNLLHRFFASRYWQRMQRKPLQRRDAGKILVQSEYTSAILQRNRRNEHIRGRKAHTLGTPYTENCRCFSVSPEASVLEQFPL